MKRPVLCLLVAGAIFLIHSGTTLLPQAEASARQKKKTIKVASPVKGIVSQVLVKEGQQVKPGDALVQLDDTLAKNGIKTAEAKVQIAKEEYKSAVSVEKEAEQQYIRELKLPPSGGIQGIVIKKLIWDQMKHRARAQFYQTKLAELRLEEANILLEMHQIQAPVAGKVLAIHKQVGEGAKELDTVIEIVVEGN